MSEKKDSPWRTAAKYFVHGILFLLLYFAMIFLWAFFIAALVMIGLFLGLILGFIALFFFIGGLNSFLGLAPGVTGFSQQARSRVRRGTQTLRVAAVTEPAYAKLSLRSHSPWSH